MKEKNKIVVSEEGIKYTVSNKVRDYSNDPLVIKKSEESVKFLKKAGFPKEFLKK